MNYATWKLDFTDPEYGTGPESKIAQLGFSAEGAWSDSEASDAVILGYVSETQDEAELTSWDFKNITQAKALEFCQAINSMAKILEDGKIAVEETEN